MYEQLAQKQTQQAEIDVVEQVSKAYYSTLVARSRLSLLGRNVQRLDTVLNQTRKIFKAGFAEKLDVDRLQVQRNNLVVEQQKAQRLTEPEPGLAQVSDGPAPAAARAAHRLAERGRGGRRGPAPAPRRRQLRHGRRCRGHFGFARPARRCARPGKPRPEPRRPAGCP
ncbi:TolC family protein [Hymenobacter humi]|uniref:TolC family protein n=1 Tax=Hymenobacter humi TaxID=1411620 RepID=A0ABW2TZ07_9BACT